MDKTQTREIVSIDDIGKIDINFPEFCFGIIGKKVKPKDQPETITYQLKNSPENKITIIRSGMGFPDQTTRDVLHALIRITLRKNKFQKAIVPATLSEIFQELGWSKNGKANQILKRHLNILLTTGIVFERSYFDKYQRKYNENVSFGTLSYFWFKEISPDGSFAKPNSDLDSSLDKGYFAWNEKFFEQSIKNSRNLIDFDYSFYLSLDTDIAKQLFLFLSKRKYGTNTLRMPLKELAFTVLGINTSMDNKIYQVRYILRKSHQQLMQKGFLSTEPKFEKSPDRTEYITYNFTTGKSIGLDVLELSSNEAIEGLSGEDGQIARTKIALLKLGVTEGQIAKLFKNYSVEKLYEVSQQITLQYKDQKKIKNLMGLIRKFLESDWDTSLAQEQDKKQKKELEARKRAEEEKERQKRLEEEKSAVRQQQSDAIDKWIGANITEYLSIGRDVLENRIKPNPVFSMWLNKEKDDKKADDLTAMTSHRVLNSVLRESIGERIFGADFVKL